jgi:hypothetical protein
VVGLEDWCDDAIEAVGAHSLTIFTGKAASIQDGCEAVAAVVAAHYATEEQVARVLARLGKPASALFIEGKLPTTKSIRSGDLGEILATEFIVDQTVYEVPIKRLRWKDHRNMAMRGDDVIGIARDPATQQLRFLKAEAKSRITLPAAVVADARAGLEKDGGLPSAHALSFISARLLEMGNTELADAIDDAQLSIGIPPQTVNHLLFVFSGNDPTAHLKASLQAYAGPMAQQYVGIRVDTHAAFVEAVFDLVIANANND